ncbi:hypothetical protein [Candidatus Tisiphia endosymbiont of Nemotelus uliginosus]|uniref:hypothetical protein n=1 Tax=Candidatus Tisiphia endosymbiont of Nemotelus uliginosus TaxID=3077926 RepID=UPI0035C89CC9
MRLANGTLWSVPITLDVNLSFAAKLQLEDEIILRNSENIPLAILKINDIWKPNKLVEAFKVFGTIDDTHPGVAIY